MLVVRLVWNPFSMCVCVCTGVSSGLCWLWKKKKKCCLVCEQSIKLNSMDVKVSVTEVSFVFLFVVAGGD